ncbi:hypothetical protein [Promicromonospora sp. NPDC090134]|uniref:hypothetical protein n=1 Tax=Promicromonospora sp. NPDC090134 TaxID=3364408 RepID=UPI003817050E
MSAQVSFEEGLPHAAEGGADLAPDLVMGKLHPGTDLAGQAAMVMDRLALEAHHQVSGVDLHLTQTMHVRHRECSWHWFPQLGGDRSTHRVVSHCV